jgi:hypothetical protein
MKKLERFATYRLVETELQSDSDEVIDNKYQADYSGEAGTYRLILYPDTNVFRLIFPEGNYLWNKIDALNLVDELNPFAQYERGVLLKWIRQVILSYHENKSREPMNKYQLSFKNYESEAEDSNITMHRFYYVSDEGQATKVDISNGGLICVTIPQRMITGSPDELFVQMPELGYVYDGKLLEIIKEKFKEVSGMDFEVETSSADVHKRKE